MKLSQLLEKKEDRKLVVVYPGRFQPFHKGHFSAYKWLCKKFGKENVWIATSNKTEFDSEKKVSPLTFDERKEIMLSMYGIPENRIVECKNPAFNPEEVFDIYKDFNIVYVTAVGNKDTKRYSQSKFFFPFPSNGKINNLKTQDDCGYYVKVPFVTNISGTEARELLTDENADRQESFKKIFGKYDSTIDRLIKSKLKRIE